MKRILLTVVLAVSMLPLFAGVTTYTFTSKAWKSTVNGAVSDEWICDKEATEYTTPGHPDASGRIFSQGVGVKTSTSGAGAHSQSVFEEVRRVTFNFCQNSSKGKGTIYVQVGENEPQHITVTKPAHSGEGVYNRDSIITFETPQTGSIKFWVECTENAIYINSISIRSSSGGSSVFTMDTYQLVTDVAQLEDSDQVIFGVAKEGVNYIMGYFDEYESSNNIHAIKGRYSEDRMMVDADERAIYTLRIADLNGKEAFIFQDEIRYEEAYLVASGGQTKNRLAVWNNVVDEKTYGNYGYWDIRIEAGGEAVITNLGNSKAKIIQYNANNNPTLFACYADRSQTPVCLYRRVEAMGDVPAIIAPLVNFGTTLDWYGERTITVNANKLTEDIHVTHTNEAIFSISSELLDRDGDQLTVYFHIPEPDCDCEFDPSGHYSDTLLFTSGDVRTSAVVLLHIERKKSVAEAVRSIDNATVYLNDVVVTKKYDTYIYVRDNTGSMLLFDRGDGVTGKRYGADVKAGDPLSDVLGRFVNYFGVPEISPTEQFKIGTNSEVLPEPAPMTIDSADVCRYLLLEDAVVNDWTSLTYNGQIYAVSNKFNLSSFDTGMPTRVYAIVSYDHDVVTLYIVKQESASQALDETEGTNRKARLVWRDGVVVVESEQGCFTLQGEKIL